MKYWLVKSDPDTYSWDDLLKDKETSWDGIRNYAARNHLRDMKKGDNVLGYHSGGESSVVGFATVTKEFYPDPTTNEEAWVSVKLKAGKPLKKPVTLSGIKVNKNLKDMLLIKISRLSVMPVSVAEFEEVVRMSIEY